MSVKWHRLGEFIERIERPNEDGAFGVDDVRGVSNTKLIQKTKASMEGRNFRPFTVLNPGEFVFNRRTTRNGERLGLGFNQDDRPYIFTEDYVAFRVKDTDVLLPEYLYVLFLRDEFDRYVRWDSWGSATEFFNWENMQRVMIPVPSIAEQRKAVEAWQGLRRMKEQNEQAAEPLMQLCRSYLEECKKKYPMKAIGEMIQESNARNVENKLDAGAVRGLSTNKAIIPTVAKLDGVSLVSYKIVSPGQFAYVSDTSRRGDKVSYGFNDSPDSYLVSSISTVFDVKDRTRLLPGYLNLCLCRPEFDRYARFNSWGSARESFSFAEMCRVKIPLPPIEVQQAVVDIFKAAQEAKRIAAEADKLSREICPALIRRAVA